MAIHDMHHFENAPQGVNLATTIYTGAYSGNTIYNQLTGNPGQPLYYTNNGNTFTVGSDGYLTMTPNSTGTVANGALLIPIANVLNWTTQASQQFWIGFRTKGAGTQISSDRIFTLSTDSKFTSGPQLVFASSLTSAGIAATAEAFVEVFIDRANLLYQVFVNGLPLTAPAALPALGASAAYLMFGPMGGVAAATSTRSFRDFYFLDVDSATPTRLGPIRAATAVAKSATGTGWTANNAADLLTALNTALGSETSYSTSVTSPANKAPLSVSLSTSVIDGQQRIVAVQPGYAASSAGGGVASLALGFNDGTNPLQSVGAASLPSGPVYNQRVAPVQTAPNGVAWTAAEFNKSSYVLTPQ